MSSTSPRSDRSSEDPQAGGRYAPPGESYTPAAPPAAWSGDPSSRPGGPGHDVAGRGPGDPRQGRRSAEAALALGILGVAVLPILAPFAVWQANKAERLGEIATAGKILGWVGVALLILAVVWIVLMFVFFGVIMSGVQESVQQSAQGVALLPAGALVAA